LAINRGGSPERPLEVRGQIPGETILNGTSTLAIEAPHAIVDGLFFYKGSISEDSVIEFKSHHGTVRNTAIVDYNPAAFVDWLRATVASTLVTSRDWVHTTGTAPSEPFKARRLPSR